ncbi:MAG: SDR family oxidoreductase [Thermoanaerobaculia bacterium]
MNLELEGKIAMVTGGSRGLGRAIAMRLAAEGCGLAICARGEEALVEVAEAVRGMGRPVYHEPLDVTEAESVDSFVEQAARQLGGLDILVNNVGGNRRVAFADSEDRDWQEILEVNFHSHVRFSRAVIPHMRRYSSGVILFIASIFGREAGGPGLSIYNTTKSALISLAKIMALELAPEGIRVNSIAPGSIRFPGGSWDRRCQEDPEGMAEFIRVNLPLGRFGTAEELADVVTFLASPRASLITGACLNADGGQSHSLI